MRRKRFGSLGSLKRGSLTPAASKIATAVFVALYGAPDWAWADQPEPVAASLQEVVVTATGRQEALEAVPYSISVVSPEQMAASGVNDTMQLASTVPGVSMYDYGARFAGAVAPIIRGINATGSPARGFRSFEQDPVGTYIGNSPIQGYFQIDDVNRVEVLRGPQGTLYGAGALGGALRFIPNSPQLETFAGSVEAMGSRLAHSDGTGYSVKGMFNVPLGDVIAFRASARYDYQPGWIKVFGPEVRTSNTLYGTPVLAEPGRPGQQLPDLLESQQLELGESVYRTRQRAVQAGRCVQRRARVFACGGQR